MKTPQDNNKPMNIQEKKNTKMMTAKPPLFALERLRELESELMFARTAPYYISTMRPCDVAYKMTEMLYQRIKNEVDIDNL